MAHTHLSRLEVEKPSHSTTRHSHRSCPPKRIDLWNSYGATKQHRLHEIRIGRYFHLPHSLYGSQRQQVEYTGNKESWKNLIKEITLEEVSESFRKASNTTPGQDGITNNMLKFDSPKCTLCNLSNIQCLHPRRPVSLYPPRKHHNPYSQERRSMTLSLKDHRPISLHPCTNLTSIMASRLLQIISYTLHSKGLSAKTIQPTK